MKELLRNASMWIALKLHAVGDFFWHIGWEGSQTELDLALGTPAEYRSARQQAHVTYLETEGFLEEAD